MFPFGYLYLLYRVRHKLPTDDTLEVDKQKRLEQARLSLRGLSDPELRPVGFLYHGYKPVFWYWEVVESYRRILFQSVLTVVGSPILKAFIGGSFALVWVGVYREVQPYAKATTNLLNSIVQYQIFLVGSSDLPSIAMGARALAKVVSTHQETAHPRSTLHHS